MDCDKKYIPPYDKADRDHMRRLLKKGSFLIDLIAGDQVPYGTKQSAEWIDLLADEIGYENEKQKDEDQLQELKEDRYLLINLYGAIRKKPAFLPLYKQLGSVLCKYGLFDEETVLLEQAVSNHVLNEADRMNAENRLSTVRQYRDLDDAAMSEKERIAETLRRALRKQPLDGSEINTLLKQCGDDRVLYDIACYTGKDTDRIAAAQTAARRISGRDYQYALSSHPLYRARTSMILNLFDSLEGDALFIARTILTDPDDRNKTHMLLYCRDESLLMLGWKHAYGARNICTERLHARGSPFPEQYEAMNPKERSELEGQWFAHASEIALDVMNEDEAVRERLKDAGAVDSEPLRVFLSIHHPGKAVRYWHANKLKNPVYIAYVGSWTKDEEIKEALSVKISSTELITEMIFGDLSAADLVFGFLKPKDLTLQDRFCFEILKNHPDRMIRAHVRKELERAEVEIPDALIEEDGQDDK